MNALALHAAATQSVNQQKSFSEMTDAELVITCQQGNERAFEALMKRHQRHAQQISAKLEPFSRPYTRVFHPHEEGNWKAPEPQGF